MFCPNCGTQNPDGTSFCGNCGAPLAANANPAPAPAPATPVAPVAPVAPTPVPQPAPSYSPDQMPIQAIGPKDNGTNAMCITGFIMSLVSIILGGALSLISLILCIIGVNSASKKKQSGRGMGIAGIIISAVIIAIWIIALIVGVNKYLDAARDARSRYEPTRRTTETEYEEPTRRTTRETTEETAGETTEATTEETTRATTEETSADTSATESKSGLYLTSVGNAKTGTVALTQGKWVTFIEAGGFSSDVAEHEQAKDISTGAIIGLFVLNTTRDAETMGKLQMASMEQQGAKGVTGARVKLGGYDAVQAYGIYPDGTILVVWYFKADDGKIRKVTVEFPSEKTESFAMVEKGYKLDR